MKKSDGEMIWGWFRKWLRRTVEEIALELVEQHEDNYEHKERQVTAEEIIAEKEA